MDLVNLIDKLKAQFPEKAIDLSESLELLSCVMNDTVKAFGERMGQAVDKRDFETVGLLSNIAEEAHKYELKVEEIITMLEIKELDEIEELDEENERKRLPNYNDYIVDTRIEHSLYEDFTHKRPHSFKIENYDSIEVSTWQEMLVKLYELFMDVDEKKCLSFVENPAMNGKKKKYFSNTEDGMRAPKLVRDKIYIETNQSGNAIRNLMIKIIKEFDLKTNDFKVFYRADYTNINN